MNMIPHVSRKIEAGAFIHSENRILLCTLKSCRGECACKKIHFSTPSDNGLYLLLDHLWTSNNLMRSLKKPLSHYYLKKSYCIYTDKFSKYSIFWMYVFATVCITPWKYRPLIMKNHKKYSMTNLRFLRYVLEF